MIMFLLSKIWFSIEGKFETLNHFPDNCGSEYLTEYNYGHNISYCALVGPRRCESYQSIWGSKRISAGTI